VSVTDRVLRAGIIALWVVVVALTTFLLLWSPS
jgi:hypothetical protein